jgi:uncharacterized RDD family membrane protein YckC
VPFPAVTPSVPPSAVVAAPAVSSPAAHATDDDLQDLLDRLHDDMGLAEQTPVVTVGAATSTPGDVTRPSLATDVVIEAGDGIAFQPSFASFGARLAGLLIDIAVLTVLCLPGIAAFALGSGAVRVVLGSLLVFGGFCAATVLYAAGISRTGQSVGNRLTKSRVVDARNGHLISAGDAGVRYVLRMLVSMVLFVGFLMALGNSQRRTFHDNIAGTVVIRPTRASWSIDDEMEQ